MGRVVVGTDGSPGGQAAVRFAVDEARMRGDLLEVVYVHVMPPKDSPFSRGLSAEVASADLYADMLERDREAEEEAQQRAQQFGQALLDRSVAAADADGIEVETTVLYDRRPARTLIDAVRRRDDVDLLVVGSRGRGELTGVILGSTSQACVTHARVPVTVVPPPR